MTVCNETVSFVENYFPFYITLSVKLSVRRKTSELFMQLWWWAMLWQIQSEQIKLCFKGNCLSKVGKKRLLFATALLNHVIKPWLFGFPQATQQEHCQCWSQLDWYCGVQSSNWQPTACTVYDIANYATSPHAFQAILTCFFKFRQQSRDNA